MSQIQNVSDYEAAAKCRLPRAIYDFVARGSEDEVQMRRNAQTLADIRLTPRMPRNVAARSTAITLFGEQRPVPFIIAPTGIAELVAYRGEIALARAAAAAGIPFTLATSSTTAMEDIGAEAKAGFWMQLYMWENRALSWGLVDRAGAAGADVLVLTVDLPVWPNREQNRRNGMANPIRPNPRLALDFACHPRWTMGVLARYFLARGGMPQFANYPAAIGTKVTGTVSRQANSATVGWADVAELRRRWPGKLIIKGILHPDDAVAALDHGVDGIAVSNHGGRNFDAGPAAIEALPAIADAVAGRAAILFDSGIRRGTDVLKARALGADAVMIGRPTLYGAAVAGEAGAAHVLAILTEELSIAMAMLGVNGLDEVGRGCLWGGG